ncbi:MAG: family 16 glycosylhydrolase [Deltaproteobacteria bacterium]|nr:family 16 glycosylhydrolase [Deltaproteobacteria bacterium]
MNSQQFFTFIFTAAVIWGCSGGDSDSHVGETSLDDTESSTPDTGSVETDAHDSDTGTDSQSDADYTEGADVDPNIIYESDTQFTLEWKDDFAAFDAARWMRATHTFDENEATFTSNNVVFEDGFMKLLITAGEGTQKPYNAGELRTIDFFTYGRFETRAKFAAGSGLISSLFTFYDHWADAAMEENWNEIDIEFLGRDENSLQYNEIVWNDQNQRVTNEFHDTLDFQPSAEFHVYAIEWTPAGIGFYIDGELRHQSDTYAAQMVLPQRIMMNAWPTNQSGWAGDIDEAALPATAYYDWVKYYSYNDAK